MKKANWRPTARKANLGAYAPNNELSGRVDDLLIYLVNWSSLAADDVLRAFGALPEDFSRWRNGNDRAGVARFTRVLSSFLDRDQFRTASWAPLPADVWTPTRNNILMLLKEFVVALNLGELADVKARLIAQDVRHVVELQMWGANDKPIDCIGIGAFNVDHIAAQSETSRLGEDGVARAAAYFSIASERLATDEKFEIAKREFEGTQWREVLGGSAFNAIRAMCAACDRLSYGYLGAVGADGRDFNTWFTRAGASGLIVTAPELSTARCLSFVYDGKRSMLPTEGANSALVDGILKYREAALNFIALSKHVHVTSIFDPRAPQVIADLIRDARVRNPHISISVDPGYVWCEAASRDDTVWSLLSEADMLFLNNEEFRVLSMSVNPDDTAAARTIVQQLQRKPVVIFQKQIDRTIIYTVEQDDVVASEVVHEAIASNRIEDSTGKGDAFAAGCVLGLLLPDFNLRDGVRLGARLAREKLRGVGDDAFDTFPQLLAETRREQRG